MIILRLARSQVWLQQLYIFITLPYFQPYSLLSKSNQKLFRKGQLTCLTETNHPKQWQLNPLQLCLVFITPPPPPSITPPTEGIQNMMGIQNVAAIFCVPLIPYCWDTKYGNHILYPLKDQRGIQNMAGIQNLALHRYWMYLTPNLFLLPNFYKFWCTNCVPDDFQALMSLPY